MHFEMVARSNDARNQFARENAKLIKDAQRGDKTALQKLKRKVGEKTYNGIRIGVTSVDSIVKYGGSVVSAVDDGRAEAGGTFKSAKVVGNGVGVAGEKGPIKTPSNTKPQTSSSNDNEPTANQTAARQRVQNALAAAARRKQEDRSSPSTRSRSRPTPTTSQARASARRAATRLGMDPNKNKGRRARAKGGLMEKDK